MLELKEDGRQDRADQRGDGPGAHHRRDLDVHHVEGARRAMAERRRADQDGIAQGGSRPLRLGDGHPQERARARRRPIPISTRCSIPGRSRASSTTWATTRRSTISSRPASFAQRIGFTAAEQKTMMVQDYEYLAKNDSQLKEWWDKEFQELGTELLGSAACVLRDGAARLLRMRRIFVPSSNRPHPEERPQVASRRTHHRAATA